VPGVEVLTPRFFNEIAVRLPRPAARVVEPWRGRHARRRAVLAPRPAGLDDVLLLAVTETTPERHRLLSLALRKALKPELPLMSMFRGPPHPPRSRGNRGALTGAAACCRTSP
jgi:hypothetical protein